jgi:hypothetical protein
LERFYTLFIKKIKFSYDLLDRIVITANLLNFVIESSVNFYFKVILKRKFVNKSVLFALTKEYNKKIEEIASKNGLSCKYILNNVRKDDLVKKYRKRFEKRDKYGIYYIFKTKENESTYRTVYPNKQENDKDNFFAKTRKPFTQYYFYIHDKILGNFSLRIASYLPFKVTAYLNEHSYIERHIKNKSLKRKIYKKRDNAFIDIKDIDLLIEAKENFTPQLIKERLDYWINILGPDLKKQPLIYDYFINQIEYSRNFIFKNHFFIKELFMRSCELSMQLISTDHIKQMFKSNVNDKFIKKEIKRLDDGYYVFKAWFKRCSIKQYRKFSNFLRFEFTCNYLPNIKINKALENLPKFEKKAQEILDRYSETEALMLNTHADVDCFKKHSKPVMIGKTKISGIHVYQERINRLMEVLLHDNRSIGEWKSSDIRKRIITEYEINKRKYSRNQTTYDIRKLRAHGIVERIKGRNLYRLTAYGIKLALVYTLMRKRIYGPLAYSMFHYQTNNKMPIESKLERLYRNVDSDLDKIKEYISGKNAA